MRFFLGCRAPPVFMSTVISINTSAISPVPHSWMFTSLSYQLAFLTKLIFDICGTSYCISPYVSAGANPSSPTTPPPINFRPFEKQHTDPLIALHLQLKSWVNLLLKTSNHYTSCTIHCPIRTQSQHSSSTLTYQRRPSRLSWSTQIDIKTFR